MRIQSRARCHPSGRLIAAHIYWCPPHSRQQQQGSHLNYFQHRLCLCGNCNVPSSCLFTHFRLSAAPLLASRVISSESLQQGLIILPIFSKTECVHALKGLALLRASHFGKIALAAHVTCVPRSRQRQSFSRTLLSQK